MKAEIRFTNLNVETCLEVLKCLINSNTEATILVQEKSVVKDNVTSFSDVSGLVASTFSLAESIRMISDNSECEKVVTKSSAKIKSCKKSPAEKQKRDRLSQRDLEVQYKFMEETFTNSVNTIHDRYECSEYADRFAQIILGFNSHKDRCYGPVVNVLEKMLHYSGFITSATIRETCGKEEFKSFAYAIKAYFAKRNSEVNAKFPNFSPVVIVQFFNTMFHVPDEEESEETIETSNEETSS